MRRVKPITDLFSSSEIQRREEIKERLKQIKTEFNLFLFFEKVINEIEWTKMFSFILNSELTHQLGTKSFLYWLNVLTKQNKTVELFYNNIKHHDIKIVRTTTEWSTEVGRRLDLLIEIVNTDGLIVGVMGIENKVNSGEQEEQVSDYQIEMVRVFKDSHKIMLFSTPDGRESKTSIANKECPCVSISYASFKDLCDRFFNETSGETKLILSSLSKYIEKVLLQTELDQLNEKQQTKLGNPAQLVDYADSIPLYNRFDEIVFGKNFDVPYIYEFAFRSWGAWQMQFFLEDHRMDIDGSGFVPCYLYQFLSKDPHIGDKYVIRFMVAWEKVYQKPVEIKNEIINGVLKELSIPNSRNQPKHFSRWINIWTSETYQLVDMDNGDLENFKNNLFDSMKKTYPVFEKKLKAFKKKHKVS